MNKSSTPGLMLFAVVTVIGMIMAVVPAAAAASPARDVAQAITHNSNAHIHVPVQTDKTATPSVATCATQHFCFQIRSNIAGYCLNAVASGVRHNGDKVQLWKCNWTGTNQLWEDGACNSGGSWCQVVNAADTSKCLNANTSGGLRDGSTAQLWSCGTASNELWGFYSPPGECARITVQDISFRCLEVERGNHWIVTAKLPFSGNGDQARMWSYAQETMPKGVGWCSILYQAPPC
jgi:hypothetical protein